MTAVRGPDGRMRRYEPDPLAPHVLLDEHDRPCVRYADWRDCAQAIRESGSDGIIAGRRTSSIVARAYLTGRRPAP